MRTRKPKSILATTNNNGVKLYVEGSTERSYLKFLMEAEVIKLSTVDPELQGSDVQKIIVQIKRDLDNGAIDLVIWIVDGGDVHICGIQPPKKHKKKLTVFQKFYKEWLDKKLGDNGRKLHILVNQPAVEFWTLLHHADCSTYFACNDDLLNSQELKNAMPAFTKGQSTKYLKDVSSKDCLKRMQAIKRAVLLDQVNLQNTTDVRVDLKISQAQIHQIFELLRH